MAGKSRRALKAMVAVGLPGAARGPLVARLIGTFNRNPFLAGILGTCVALLMSSVSVLMLYQGRAEALDHANETSANLAALISNDVERNVELCGLSLQAMVDGAQQSGIMALPADLRREVLFDRATTAQYLGGAYILDRNGQVSIAQDGNTHIAGDFSDRDYFTVQRDNPGAGLYVSDPFRSRLRHDNWMVALSRRINAPDGSFAGIALVTIRIEYLEALLAKVKTGASGAIFIVQRNGTLMAREPFSRADTGRDVSRSPVFAMLLGHPSGSFVSRAQIDGVSRLYNFATIPSTPLIVAVAPSRDEVLAPWRRQSLVVGALTLLFGASFIGMSWLLAFALRERAHANAILIRLAGTDALTGLSNRRTLESRFADEWRRARRSNTPISCLFIDVDNFKLYNDAYGHSRGDDALVMVADCIEAVIRRPGDIAARYGGEEFVVLLTDTHPEGALVIAEALRARVQGQAMSHPTSRFGVVTVSVGCMTSYPRSNNERGELLKQADKALYAAKASGRNRVVSAAVSGATSDMPL